MEVSKAGRGGDVEVAVANEARLTTKQGGWLEHIRRCESQGLSFPKYCEREGLNVNQLYAARRVLIDKGCLPGKEPTVCEAPRFAAVRLSQPNASLTLEVLLPNHVQVRISCDDAAQTCAVIVALSQL